jgi:hypothetical protein
VLRPQVAPDLSSAGTQDARAEVLVH